MEGQLFGTLAKVGGKVWESVLQDVDFLFEFLEKFVFVEEVAVVADCVDEGWVKEGVSGGALRGLILGLWLCLGNCVL